jgi:threonine/homoserine/homoserine lactone efflux protein
VARYVIPELLAVSARLLRHQHGARPEQCAFHFQRSAQWRALCRSGGVRAPTCIRGHDRDLGALLLASGTLFTALKFGGAAYLVWIGIKLFRSGPTLLARPSEESGDGRASYNLRQLTKQEFIVAAGNPKAILVFTAFFPQFVDRSAYATSFTVLGATFLVLELVAISVYAVIGARLGTLVSSSRGLRWFNRVSGSTMIGFGLLLAFLRRPAT